MISVAKFGGSSLRDAFAFNKVFNILITNTNLKVIVLSAVGQVTDQLSEILTAQVNNKKSICNNIVQTHRQIVEELGISSNKINDYLKALQDEMMDLSNQQPTFAIADQLLSIGERFSSRIMISLLEKNEVKSKLVPATDIIITDDCFTNARPDINEIKIRCQDKIIPYLKDYTIITEGFIGSSKNNKKYITTLGRGGSDISAALIAEAIISDSLYIFTDVNGVYTVDPNIVKDSTLINQLNYERMLELANLGASVLHPKAIVPCKRFNIPIVIKSTFSPEKEGTLICDKEKNYSFLTITHKKCQYMVESFEVDSNNLINFFDKYPINFDFIEWNDINRFFVYEVNKIFERKIYEELLNIKQIKIKKELEVVIIMADYLNDFKNIITKYIKNSEFHIDIFQCKNKLNTLYIIVANGVAEEFINFLYKFIKNNKEEILFNQELF
ncbi:MAG: aspartate kinase [Arcobacter sp.]|nr:aspartate kinase [Arcobacter sp.]